VLVLLLLFLFSDSASLLDRLDHVLPELRDVRLLADHHVDLAVASAVNVTAGRSVTEGRGGLDIHTHSPGIKKFGTPDVENCASVMDFTLSLEHVTEGLKFLGVHVAVAQVLDELGDSLTEGTADGLDTFADHGVGKGYHGHVKGNHDKLF